jgi:ATP-dependent Clp protease ATP-binding subunit ClpC
MPAYRFPILVLQDAAGGFTATLVEDNGDVAAFGSTAAEARQRLREHLDKIARTLPSYPRPDFEDPQLTFHRVELRPEYSAGGRAYPASETIPLRVAVVSGRTTGGLRVAALPTLRIRFNYYAADDLKPLVVQYVQNLFRQRTPGQMAHFLLPPVVELDDIVVQFPREMREREEAPEMGELAAIADPLTSRELRTRFGRAWGREELVNRFIQIVAKQSAPILLLGEGGVGKTSILADAARRIERGGGATGPVAAVAITDGGDAAPARPRRVARFWLTSAPRIIAAMQYLGMWQERVETVIAQADGVSAVVCFENLLDLVRIGGRTPGDSIGAFLVPYLQRSEMRLVTEATPAEFDAVRRLLPALADLFQIITVPPFARGKAIDCLTQSAQVQRQNQKIDVEPRVVETIYRLFSRFLPYHAFPGRSSAFLDQLFEEAARRDADRITPDDAIRQFVEQTGLPGLFLRDEQPLQTEAVVQALHADVIGQENACREAARVVITFKAGLNDPNRPLGVMLFTGPTGVGKTQLALSLAKFLFGANRETKARLIRLDMSEYSGADAADRFLGSPHSGPADWIQNVRRQPFTVLLLDEIEKAAPEIFDVLMGAFDEGRLTDPWGRLTHFTSAMIVMTSNLGAGTAGPFGLSRSAPPAYESEAMGYFRPEFFNRIDRVVTFDALTPQTIRRIAEKELRDLQTREGLVRFQIVLKWNDRVVDRLVDEGFDARYGARPLQRAVETLIVTPLAKYLVEHPEIRGAISLDVDPSGGIRVVA